MRGTSKLPTFWKQALTVIRSLRLTPLKLSMEGALSQPIWKNPTLDGPNVSPRWAELWSKLKCNVVHNIYKDFACTKMFTEGQQAGAEDECAGPPRGCLQWRRGGTRPP
eukprot:scaffold31973_cov41-Tisochrysis_lutea.AAC.3